MTAIYQGSRRFVFGYTPHSQTYQTASPLFGALLAEAKPPTVLKYYVGNTATFKVYSTHMRLGSYNVALSTNRFPSVLFRGSLKY